MKETLDFKKNKVEILTTTDLRNTVDERRSGGKPINNIRHIELWDNIIDRMTKNNINFDINPIYATDGGSSILPGVTYVKDLEAQHGEDNIRNFILRRVIGSFTLKDHLLDKDTIGQIAISYHQQGIMIAYGQHVHLCSNLAIMGRDNVMSTYGEGIFGKITNIEHILEVVEAWALHSIDKRKVDLKRIDIMKEYSISYKDMEEFIGHLNILRIKKDVFHNINHYALNQGQINTFTEKYLKGYDDKTKNPFTLWDVYNLGTEFHKAGTTDMPFIIPNNVSFYEAINEKFNIDNLCLS
jgi:hypothetical protein